VSKLIILIIFLFTALQFSNANSIYQTMTLNDDGSGTIKLNYSSTGSVLKANNFILGNLPFSEELVKNFFASPNSTVKNAKLNFDKNSDKYSMTVEIDFKDINVLNKLAGFKNVKASWKSSGSGMDFTYTLIPTPAMTKFFESQSYIVTFQSPVKSSNGVTKEKTVTWGNRNQKNSDFTNDVNLTAVIDAEGSSSSNNTSSTGEKKESSCGLFGLELPLIMLGGYIFTSKMKKRK
jgi:hypothetical protein